MFSLLLGLLPFWYLLMFKKYFAIVLIFNFFDWLTRQLLSHKNIKLKIRVYTVRYSDKRCTSKIRIEQLRLGWKFAAQINRGRPVARIVKNAEIDRSSAPCFSLPSLPLPVEVGPLNPARGPGERCKLPQRGLGRIPSRIEFGAY